MVYFKKLMVKYFLLHSIKSFFRILYLDFSYIFKLLSIISIFLTFAVTIACGIYFEFIVKFLDPDLNAEKVFIAVISYSLVFGFLFLFLSNNLLLNQIETYLVLNVNRNTLAKYIIAISQANLFSVYFQLFIIPVIITVYSPIHGFIKSILYLLILQLFLFFITQISLTLKIIRNFYYSQYVVSITIILIYIALFLEGEGIQYIQTKIYSISLFESFQLFVILPVVIFAIIFLNKNLLKKSFYYTTEDKNNSWSFKSHNNLCTNNTVKLNIGYSMLEIKMITRNKRLLSFFLMSIGILTLFYFFINELKGNDYEVLFIYTMFSGFLGYMFAQYLFSWESSFFDLINLTPFDVIMYVKAKQ